MQLKNFIRPLFNQLYLDSHFSGKLGSKIFGKSRILGFHSILEENHYEIWHPNKSLVFSVSELEDLIKKIRTRYSFISINEVLKNSRSTKKDMSVCLTFDDGYKDNLYNLLPLLKVYNIPAVVYVTSSFLSGDYWNWWDNLGFIVSNFNNVVLKSGPFNGEYNIYKIENKIRFYTLLKNHLIRLYIDEQKLFFVSNNIYYKKKQSPFMDWKEIKTMINDPLITIGSHTHTHASFKYANEKVIDYEIGKCIDEIKKTLGLSIVEHFALPYGHNFTNYRILNKVIEKFSIKTILSTSPISKSKNYLPRLLYSNV
jgi:peptidoglycan/xylan/chitin deacetylase (PgdA/CDA1 family)